MPMRFCSFLNKFYSRSGPNSENKVSFNRRNEEETIQTYLQLAFVASENSSWKLIYSSFMMKDLIRIITLLANEIIQKCTLNVEMKYWISYSRSITYKVFVIVQDEMKVERQSPHMITNNLLIFCFTSKLKECNWITLFYIWLYIVYYVNI